MMKNLSHKFLLILMFATLLCSCVNNKYDLDNIDDSGGLNPALVLPIGTLETNVLDLITEAGISEDSRQTEGDTIYIVYKGELSFIPNGVSIPDIGYDNVIPPGISFKLDDESESIDIYVFDELASSGSKLHPTNPKIQLNIKNYIGADIDIDVKNISSYGNGKQTAIFKDGSTSYLIHVGGAKNRGEYTSHSETFDKSNGQLHELFKIAPNKLSYDFGIDLNLNDGKPHFIVGGKYVDIDYEIKIPLTFDAGTQLAGADTLALDLSGDDFVSNLDALTLWIDYENGLRTTFDLDILFLDEDKNLIPDIDKHFHIKAPSAAVKATRDAAPVGNPAKGSLTLRFNESDFKNAEDVRYVILKTILKVDGDAVNIRPTDYINLKLSAYSKVNI